MSRTSNDQRDANGNLINGYDYANQAWVVDGKYVRCGHSEDNDCGCFGREHAGETVLAVIHASHTYTDTPCGRCIRNAERELGPLTLNQKADLLLDNFYMIANFEDALEMVKTVTVQS